MNHITQEQVLALYNQCKIHDKFQGADRHTALCNAAIEWYIAQQAAPTKEQT